MKEKFIPMNYMRSIKDSCMWIQAHDEHTFSFEEIEGGKGLDMTIIDDLIEALKELKELKWGRNFNNQ